jgi:hypothetical protein
MNHANPNPSAAQLPAGVAVESNIQPNSQITPEATPNEKRTFQVINSIIPAGQTLPFPINGDSFFVLAASGPLSIRQTGGGFATYYAGQGYLVDRSNIFKGIEIKNPNAAAGVVFSLMVGFGRIEDQRQIINSQVKQALICQTGNTGLVTGTVADLTGTLATDVDGVQWYLINRIAALFTVSLSTGNLTIQNAAATQTVALFLAGLPIPPLGPVQGGLLFSVSTGVAYCLETYNALPIVVT